MRICRRLLIAVLAAAFALIAATAAVSQVAGDSTLCLNPLTCIPPHDAVGNPEPLGADRNIAADNGAPAVQKPQCGYLDRMMTIRSSYLGNRGTTIRNTTPEHAIARYLSRQTLPSGLSATDWVPLNADEYVDRVLYITRRVTQPRVILGVISLQVVNTSWRVNWMMACGEYLYPGSIYVEDEPNVASPAGKR